MTQAYPSAPVCAVGAIVFRGSAVLLVQRAKPPAQGKWSIPGGVVQLGETLEEAVIREFREEVQLEVRPLQVGKVLDRIYRDAAGQVCYHYVIVDYLCEPVHGELRPASDASAAAYFEVSNLESVDITEGTAEVIREVFRHWRTQG
jgi:8-oxo-dGTP diphosphatase